MDFKSIARPYQWEDVTLWFLPYRHYLSDVAIEGLEAITPQAEYVNKETGARSSEMPAELAKAREKAARRNLPQSNIKTAWQTRRLWTDLHDLFWLVLPSIVAVDMPDDPLPIQQAFYAFFTGQSKDIPTRWQEFNMIIGSLMINALWDGFNATRDNAAPAHPEMAQAVPPDDPKGAVSGAASETSTSDS